MDMEIGEKGRVKRGRLVYFKIEDDIEFMDKFGKIVLGKCTEVNVVINKYQTNIFYEVEKENGDFCRVDGDAFRQF